MFSVICFVICYLLRFNVGKQSADYHLTGTFVKKLDPHAEARSQASHKKVGFKEKQAAGTE